jgi:hypothetical protein
MTDAGQVSSSDRDGPDTRSPTTEVAAHRPAGRRCGVGRSRSLAAVGLPFGVGAGPILADPVGTRHLARQDRDGRYRTLCGRLVPAGHDCPTDDELRAARMWTPRSCGACHRAWLKAGGHS